MARHSSDLVKKLLRAGHSLLKDRSLSTISVRDIAQRAGVNLGMFNYHFGTKDNFIKTLIEDVYAPFVADLENQRSQPDSLEEILFRMARFSREHSESILFLLADAVLKEKNVMQFMKTNFGRHFLILKDAIAAHFADNKYPDDAHEHAFRFLVAAVGLPNLMASLQARLFRTKNRHRDSDEDLRRRVRAAIAGLPALCNPILSPQD